MTATDAQPVPCRMHPRWLVGAGNLLFRVRNGLFPVIFAAIIVLTRPAQFLGDDDLDVVAMAVGAVVALAGQGFRLLVIGYAYIVRGGKNKKVYARDLVVAGLYAHTRNPMYVGNFLIACGVSIVYGSPWMYFLVIPFFAFVYLAITAAEEEYLLGRFGEAYASYMRDVNRFVPNFKGLRGSLEGHRYRWRTVISKDFGTAFATLTGLVAIVLWKKYCLHGWADQGDEIRFWSWIFIPLGLAYVVILALKRAGKLLEPAAA